MIATRMLALLFAVGSWGGVTAVHEAQGRSDSKKQKVLLTGSSTLAPLMMEAAKVFERQQNRIQIDVQTGGSGKGVADCRGYKNDLGMISRNLHSDESEIRSIPVARDGLALVVHKTNPITNLTKEQVVKIFDGTIKNWKTLGGADLDIVVMSKAEGRAALELFSHYFAIQPSRIKAQVIIGDEEQGLKTLTGIPGGIGYLGLSSAAAADQLSSSRVKSVALDGQMPTLADAKAGRYPLTRQLSLIQCRTARVPTKAFIDFVLSSEGQKAIEKLGVLPL